MLNKRNSEKAQSELAKMVNFMLIINEADGKTEYMVIRTAACS